MIMVEIDRQQPFNTEHAFGIERVLEGALTIDLRDAYIVAEDGTDGTRSFLATSSDGAVTVHLTGLTPNSNLVKKP